MTDMLVDIRATILLLCITVVVKISWSLTICDNGWFGDSCRFMCHCSVSPTCEPDGSCPSGDRCALGFFGPGCQYADKAEEVNFQTEQYLVDGNDSSCNPNHQATTVRVAFDNGIQLPWFRIHVSNPRNLLSFTVQLNGQTACANEKKFPASSTSVDVTCDFNSTVLIIDVIGAVAPDVCSIYISRGRNVAPRQSTRQSCSLSNLISDSENAVDGDMDPYFSHGHCSHTCNDTVMVEWSLTFHRPFSLSEIVIVNRLTHRERIRNFTILAYSESRNLTFEYTEQRSYSTSRFFIQIPTRTPIAVIKIQRVIPDEYGYKVLTLCEVLTFSEAVCPDGFYGLYCTERCTCDLDKLCFTVTGACSPGCPSGLHGFNCQSQCSSHCMNAQCQQRLGSCVSCKPGFSGQYCDRECQPGTYGANCANNCSEHCADDCDQIFGYCRCKQPYTGERCTECPPSFFGINCTELCPSDCKSSICHEKTGECVSCHGGRTGSFCQNCPPNLYGASCYTPCSQYCANMTCDIKTGNCAPCTKGYIGPKCTLEKRFTRDLLHVFSVGVLLIIVLTLCVCFLIPRRRKYSYASYATRQSSFGEG